MNIPTLPKPKVDGIGHVRYRCATCGEQMEPERAVILEGKSYHPDHLPERSNGR